MQTRAKSMYMSSTTGRTPVNDAPTPVLTSACSEIGVFRTRAGPNSSTSPFVHPDTPPRTATSSPMMKTRGARVNSSARASRIAWAYSDCHSYPPDVGLPKNTFSMTWEGSGSGLSSANFKAASISAATAASIRSSCSRVARRFSTREHASLLMGHLAGQLSTSSRVR